MNFYPFHIGDFFIATAHLSWDEGHAYRLLLDLYYKEEAPLPADTAQIARLLRISNKSHLRAIDSVLREFFTLTDAGWVNRRCDTEIARYKGRSGLASASANARWNNEAARGRARAGGARRVTDEPADSNPASSPDASVARPDEPETHVISRAIPRPCERNANALRTHSERSANALQAQSERIASAMPSQCEGNATNTRTITMTRTNPKPASSAAGEVHDHAPARSACAGAPGDDAAARDGGGAGKGEVSSSTAHKPPAASTALPICTTPATTSVTTPATPPVGTGAEPGAAPGTALPSSACRAEPIAQAIPDPPASLADWHNFFTRAGFAPKHLANQNTRAAMLDWVRLRVTQAHMRDVMARARARPDNPTSPAYFEPMIRQDFDAARRSGAPPFIALPGVAAIAGIGAGADAPRRPSIEPI
jgi:uncharacterized protein YdaU (DUF1376 family)